MATIRQLHSGKWNAQVRIAGRKPVSSTHPTRYKAETWAKSQETNHPNQVTDTPQKGRPKVNTINKLIPSYLKEAMTVKGKQRGGYEAIMYKLNTLSKFFHDQPLENITSEAVASYRSKRMQSVAGSTVRLEMQLLSRLLRWAKAEKGIKCDDVVQPVKLPPPRKPRVKIIEPLEYQMLLDAISPRIKPIVILAYETAMRRGEILSIRPEMVDLRRRVLHLTQTKNGESRDVPLSSIALSLLTELCDGRDSNQELFPYVDYTVTQGFRRAARRIKLTDVFFHSLRHTAITRYADKGLNTIQLQCISGHKSITMLARYSHIKASSVVDLMGLVIWGGAPLNSFYSSNFHHHFLSFRSESPFFIFQSE
ncbi:MAG: site-specific integrase [Pantoea sp. Morm]|uniref:tyrosine-type recombinase/integrase n=1 Tax=Pantoea sp. Morm TaxID=2601250 RepID=UPI001E155E16|nr:site-specific integrase [Pantoea sp. Morm]